MTTALLSGLPAFLIYFSVALAFLAAFAFVYTRITAHDEFVLVRAGNPAAVAALLGALAGFALPLSKAVAQSASIPDLAVWATVAFTVQIAVHFVARLAIPNVTERIDAGEFAAGAWMGGMALIVGILNSASMTYTP